MGTHSMDVEVANLRKREKALRKVYGGKTITLQGQTLTGQAAADKCAQLIAAESAVDAANRTWRAAVATRNAMRKSAAPLFQSLQSLVQATYGKSSQTLAAFGFKPVEKGARSAEVKAQAVAKLRATRKARNTMGKQQRKGIRGVVPNPPARAG